MSKVNLSLMRIFRIVNTFWVPAGLIYFFAHVSLTGSVGITASWGKYINAGISFIARIVLFSWVWGLIIEILSGEDAAARFSNFKANVQRGWRVVLAFFLAPFIVHGAIKVLSGQDLVPLGLVRVSVGIIAAYWAAGQLVRIKYSEIAPRKFGDLPFSFPLLAKGVALFVLSAGTFFLGQALTWAPFFFSAVEVVAIEISFLAFAVFAAAFLEAQPEIARHFESKKTLILVNCGAGGIFEEVVLMMVRSYPPFFAVLRALTPSEYRVIEYNRFLWRDYYCSDALVAISCFTSNCAQAYQIAREFKRCGSKVIMGGPHVSFFPDEALEFCDSVVIGPAEGVWGEVVSDYENGALKPVYRGAYTEAAAEKVHQHLMNAPVGVASDFLQAHRGCKFNCYFCANRAITGVGLLEKRLQDLRLLVEKICLKRKRLLFIDNNIYADPVYAKDLFRALIPLKIVWGGSASIDIAKDDEAVQLLKASGCKTLLIGYEIIPGSTEEARGGKVAMAQEYIQLTQKLKKAGVKVKAHFIFGFPDDSWRSLFRMWAFSFKLSPLFSIVSFLTPIPGARFFDDVLKEERMTNLNWRVFDLQHQVWMHPKLRRSWFLEKGFFAVTALFTLTASSGGRFVLLLGIFLEVLYWKSKGALSGLGL